MQTTFPEISLDDGAIEDVKAAALLDKYGIQATFYIPVLWQEYNTSQGRRPLSIPELKDIAKTHYIGSHTISHRHLTKIPIDEAEQEIRDSKTMLEDLLQVPIKTFCPPRGYITKELEEFAYKYYDYVRLTKGPGLVHIHPDSGANSNVHWTKYVDMVEVRELWGHSWEIEKYALWDELEDYIK